MLYNELVLQIRRPLSSRGSGQIFDLCNSFTRNRANTVIDCSTRKRARFRGSRVRVRSEICPNRCKQGLTR